MKALMLKELREIVAIAVLALAAYLALVMSLMGTKLFYWIPGLPQGPENIPFLSTDFQSAFAVISGVFVLALGFRQSVWESTRGTFLFLLHRPVARRQLLLTKLATGIVVFLLCGSVPILLYAWWASVPGHHPGPFFWSMTGPAWRAVVSDAAPVPGYVPERAAAGAGGEPVCCRWLPPSCSCFCWNWCRGGGFSVFPGR